MSWDEIQLGKFLTLKRGYDLPSSRRKEGDVPIVSSSGITGHHKEAKVSGPGVVTGRYGTLGEVFYVQEDFWPLNTALYVQDFKGNNSRFTAYFLKDVLKGGGSDKAAVPGVNRNDLHARKVRVTRDPHEQDAIVSVLSAYDDLIENNRRRIQLLEAAARLLYKEWFVHLRFPGHEHVKITDGVPEGWERKPLGDFVEFANGKAMKANEEGAYPVYGSNGIIGRTSEHRFDDGVVIGRVGAYCGSIESCRGRFWASDNTIVATAFSGPVDHSYLYHMLKQMDLNRFAGGAAQPLLTQTNLKRLPFVLPPSTLRREFNEFAGKVFRQLDCLSASNTRLAQARDLLLPRLMNGEIPV